MHDGIVSRSCPYTLLLQATEALRITSPELVKFRIMDEIIPEPLGGAHSDPMAAFPAIKEAIMNTYHQCVPPLTTPKFNDNAARLTYAPSSRRHIVCCTA
jgi:acetyl-CoA carboxylase alpha subunit